MVSICSHALFFLNFRSMIVEAKAKSMPVAILDLELMTLTNINSNRSFVVDLVTRALEKNARKKLMMFAHNTIGH